MNNVVIKKRTQSYNIDALNRTAVCEQDIQNGSVFALKEYSKNEGESMVWKATAPEANTDKGIWMATSPEVVIIKDAAGNEYKGLTPDPRAFINYAGKMIDATKLVEGDIIEMTCEGITGAGEIANKYLVIDANQFVLKAQSSETTGFCLERVGEGRLNIGNGNLKKVPAKTYKYVCKNN